MITEGLWAHRWMICRTGHLIKRTLLMLAHHRCVHWRTHPLHHHYCCEQTVASNPPQAIEDSDEDVLFLAREGEVVNELSHSLRPLDALNV